MQKVFVGELIESGDGTFSERKNGIVTGLQIEGWRLGVSLSETETRSWFISKRDKELYESAQIPRVGYPVKVTCNQECGFHGGVKWRVIDVQEIN